MDPSLDDVPSKTARSTNTSLIELHMSLPRSPVQVDDVLADIHFEARAGICIGLYEKSITSEAEFPRKT
jgi:hypothetical protein